ncbi:uncharacterized protein LOC119600451 [Lucilia sericata]|uniref:uncharacterized protein LOC119600451 n=1 Tax=Lucilia sericata TaxID=13632 RepID=UPI0018A862ED|nr:uncharacterized protein LOC119600451 [Lucilia sericata]
MKSLVIFLLLSICVICVYGSIAKNNFAENSTDFESSSVQEVESRRRKTGYYFIHPYHGWHALSWIYWIKVKLIVVAFFVGTAFIWAIQYLGKFYRDCPSGGHIHYGHYRALENDDPAILKFLQNLN